MDVLNRFIKEIQIFSGENRIPNGIIYYYYYNEWEPTGKKLKKTHFFREFSKEFESMRTGKTRYYLLDCPVFLFNIDMWEKANKFNN